MARKNNSNNDTPMYEEVSDGYILDFISRQLVKEGPEEIKAVQIYSRILVEDYGYPKYHMSESQGSFIRYKH